jgi:hypothetical protein
MLGYMLLFRIRLWKFFRSFVLMKKRVIKWEVSDGETGAKKQFF